MRPVNDPWDAWTLEWSTTSPPPEYNFAVDAGSPQPPPAVGPEASRKIPTGSTSEGSEIDPHGCRSTSTADHRIPRPWRRGSCPHAAASASLR